MKKIYAIITAVIATALAVTSCHVSKNAVSTAFPSAVQFQKLEMDGSITVRAAGQGRNYRDALDQADKLAVKELLFKGINIPGNAFMSKPLITEVNAEEKYQDFFNVFFTDGGDYLKFVSAEDKRTASTVETKSDNMVKMTATVRVLRAELKQYLIEHNVLKQ